MAINKEQLDIATKLASLMDHMVDASDKLNESHLQQVEIMKQLTNVIKKINADEANEQLVDIGTNVKGVSDKFEEMSKTSKNSLGELVKNTSKSGETFEKFAKSVAIGAAALSGVYQGAKNLVGIGKGVLGFATGLADAFIAIAGGIISIPFKMFNGLVEMASNTSLHSTELLKAIEGVRKEFGALSQSGPKTLMSMSTEMRGFAATGLNANLVFGKLSDRLTVFLELAKVMGASFDSVKKELKESGGAIVAWQKGLGLSDDAMKHVAVRSITFGTSMSSQFTEVQKQSFGLGKTFDIATKTISRGMLKAQMDVKHFAGATVKEIGQAVVYSHKLGVELDSIVATLDAFDSFDSAADNASKLSQAFGVNVDAFKMMEAQDPAQQVDMLRKAFASAGQDAASFNRQQISLLSSTTNLSPEIARQVFSLKNVGVSLEDVKKKSEGAEKQQLTQAEAMSKLADSIERMIQDPSGAKGGFFDRFFHGFKGGIQSSKEFRTLIQNINNALMSVEVIGVKLGRTFVGIFPGLRNVLGSLSDFFEPAKFTKFFDNTTNQIIKFFKDFTTGKYSFSNLMDDIQKSFFNFFDSSKSAGKGMLSGFKDMFLAMSKIAGEGMVWVSEKLSQAMDWVVNLLSGKSDITLPGTSGVESFLGKFFKPLITGLEKSWTILKPAIGNLMVKLGDVIYETAKDVLWPKIKEHSTEIITGLATILFGPALFKSIVAAVTVNLAKGSISLAKSLFTGTSPILQKAAEEVAASGSKVASISPASNAVSGLQTTETAVKASNAIAGEEKKGNWGVQDAVKLGLKLAAIAAAIAVGGVAIAASLVAMKAILTSGGITKVEDALPPLAIMGGVILGSIPMMAALKLAEKLGDAKSILAGGAVVGLTMGAVGLISGLLAAGLNKAGTPEQLDAAGTFMAKMSLVFLAMIPLIVASTALGMVVSGPGALLLAAAAAGLATIGLAISGMIEISVGIMKQLSELKIDSTFQPKIDAFLGVLKAIQTFTNTLVDLIKLMQPTFSDLLTGVSITDKVDASVKLIDNLIGRQGQGRGIIGVVELVAEQIKTLSMYPNLAENASVFASVLTAVTQLTQALTPSKEFFEVQYKYNETTGQYVASDNVSKFVTYVGQMKGAVTSIIESLSDMITKFMQLPVPSSSDGKTMASIMSATASLMQAAMPNPQLIAMFKSSVKTGEGFFSVSKEIEDLDTAGLRQFIKVYVDKMKDLIPVLTGGIIKSIGEAAKDIKPGSEKAIESISSVLSVVSSIITSIGDMTKKQDINLSGVTIVNSQTQGLIPAMPELKDTITSISEAMKTFLPDMISSVNSIGETIKKEGGLSAFNKNVEISKTLVKFITDISGVIGTIQEISGDPKIGALNTGSQNVVSQAFGNIKSFFESLTQGDNPLKKVIETFTTENSPLKQISELLTPQILADVENATTKVSQYGASMEKLTKSIGNEGFTGVLSAASDMVRVANNLNDKLAEGLKDLKIAAHLGTLASGLGLGGKYNYEIKNKDVVINITFDVTMNADDLEKAMVLREKSTIRDRLNFATSNNVGRTTDALPASTTNYAFTPAVPQ